MTVTLICDNCGAKIEIEDTSNLETMDKIILEKEEEHKEIHLCENCIQNCTSN